MRFLNINYLREFLEKRNRFDYKSFLNLKKWSYYKTFQNYLKNNEYLALGLFGGIALFFGIIFSVAYYDGTAQEIIQPNQQHSEQKHNPKEGHGEEETPPETFVLLELFSEALESHFGGFGVKIAELKPKVEHIQEMYQEGEKHKAFVTGLGIATEVIMLGFFIETFGIAELFISSLSFQDNWLILMGQSMIGVMLSTKLALFIGEKVEEAAEHRYEHEVHAEALARQNAQKGNPSH